MLNSSLLITALLAGVAGGSHCIGMCGGIASLLVRSGRGAPKEGAPAEQAPSYPVIPIIPLLSEKELAVKTRSSWFSLFQLHAGRISLYAILGAVVGLFGTAGLLFKPILPVQSILFYVGNFSLLYLGLRCLGYTPGFGVFRSVGHFLASHITLPVSSPSLYLPSNPFFSGLLWGCMPCGLVYGVLPLALMSGSAWSGALLMVAFGLGALPYLLLTQGLAQRFGNRKPPRWLAVGAAMILIGLGLLGLFLPNEHHTGGWWC